MDIKNQLRNSFPNNIEKTSEIFSALVANDKGTAVIQSVLQDLTDYMKEWYSTPSLYEQEDTQLEKTIDFFSYIERFTDETDKSLKNRVAAVFIRNHDTSWGSRYNVKRVFEQYFPSGNIYVIENSFAMDDSLLQEGDFLSNDLTFWNGSNIEVDRRARFSKSNGVVLLDDTSSLSQQVSVDSGECSAYWLHFFCLGKCSVTITDNNGRFWNAGTSSWQDTETSTDFETAEWNDCDLWYSNFTESEEREIDSSITSVTITFSGNSGAECYIDYVRLFPKYSYPSFTVIAQFTSLNSYGAMAVFRGENDPADDAGENEYGSASYYNGAYMTGLAAGFAQDLYMDLLDCLKAAGVKANIEIVSKDVFEDEL